MGLRADPDYVEPLEADAAAVTRGSRIGLGFAVTEAEMVRLETRETRSMLTMTVLERYGREHASEWAGLSIDEESGGVVTARFTGHLDVHRRAIERLIRPDARVDLLEVPWSLQELQQLADRVRDERDRLTSIGAEYNGGGVDIVANRALIDVLSQDPEIEDKVVNLFDAMGKMNVRVDTGLRWGGGFGLLTIVAQTPDGEPVPGLVCTLIPDEEAALPEGGSGTPTDDDGRCHEAGGATGYEVRLMSQDDPAGSAVATVRTRIVADQDTVVVIEVPEPS